MADNRPKLKKVVINGIDISGYVRDISVNEEYDKYIGVCNITCTPRIKELLGTTIIDDCPGWSITWQRGVSVATEEYAFRGEIIKCELNVTGFTFECFDKYYEAVRASINTSYDVNIDDEAGVGSEIFKSMIQEKTSLTVDNTSVVNTGTTVKIKKFVCKNTDVYERCIRLTQFYNYQSYYDSEDDKTYFEPKGYHITGQILTVGNEIIDSPKWVVDKSKIVNKLTIKGAEQLVGYSQFQNGDNTEGQTVVLTYTPKNVKTYVGTGAFDPSGTGTKPSDNEANLLEGGKIGSTSGEYDYNYDDDKRIRTVYFYNSSKGTEPSFTPPSGTNNIEIQITYGLPVQVKVSDEASIIKYQETERELELTDIKNFDDAYNYAKAYLSFYSTPFISTTLNVSNAGSIKVGRIYTIVDTPNGIEKDVIVTKVTKRWPYNYDEVTVGTEVLRELEFNAKTLDRLKRLEEAVAESDDLLIESIDLINNVNLEPRHFKQQYKDRSGDGINTFILGHATMGVLGTQKLGDGGGSFTTVCLIPGKNSFKELVYDDEYYDSASSTGITYNTTTNIITLAASGVFYSEVISLGITYNYYTLSLGSNTGDFTFEISANGKTNWQTCVYNTRTILNNTNTSGVYFRITETSGVSTATLSTTKDITNRKTIPAITIKLEE